MENQNFLIRILSNPKQLRLVLVIFLLVALVVLGVFGYQIYINQQDQRVSIAINELVRKKSNIQQQFDENEINTDERNNELTAIADELVVIYEENTITLNAQRALLTAAQIDKTVGNSDAAREKLETLLNNHSGSDQEPLVRYYLALLYEDARDYDGALSLLTPFQVDYLGHYLRPLAMFTEARLYALQGHRDKALAKYNEILAVEEFSFFFDRVQEQLDLMSLESQASGTSVSTQNLGNIGGDLAPDYNNPSSSGENSLDPDYQQNE